MSDNLPSLAFTTATLIAVAPTLKRPSSFLLDRFFPGVQMADSEFVAIDIIIGKRRMAPFVSPLVEGKLVEQLGTDVKLFKPPYVKDKRAPDLRRPVMRQVGERIGGGQLKGAEREAANLNAEMTDQLQMLTRRMEWMAAQELQYGKVLVSGEGFPTSLVDFGRDESLTIALSGNHKWGVAANLDDDGRDPLPERTIDQAAQRMLRLSGAQGTDLVFTPSAWDAFKNGKNIYGAINFPKLAESGNVINPATQVAPGAVYKGRWGQFDLWLYNEWFVDDDNVERSMLEDGVVLMAGADLMGVRAFGQIIDPQHSYEAMPFAPKTWLRDDPAQRMLMLQSSPLPIPTRVNASLAMTVCDPLTDLDG
jgi:hypothetical protein